MSGKKSKEKRKKEKEMNHIPWYEFIANHWDELKYGLEGWLPTDEGPLWMKRKNEKRD